MRMGTCLRVIADAHGWCVVDTMFQRNVGRRTMAEVVEGTVQKWGNGLAIRLTQRVAKASGVREGTDVVIRADEGVLVVEAKNRRMTLQERLERFDAARHGGEAMPFGPAGREKL
jgi:antitoxin MazE